MASRLYANAIEAGSGVCALVYHQVFSASLDVQRCCAQSALFSLSLRWSAAGSDPRQTSDYPCWLPADATPVYAGAGLPFRVLGEMFRHVWTNRSVDSVNRRHGE